MRRTGQFLDNPVAERHAQKGKFTRVPAFIGHQCIFLRKLRLIRRKQTEHGAANPFAILVYLQAVDVTADQFIYNGLAVIYADVDNCCLLSLIGKFNRILFIGNNVVAVGCVLFDVQLGIRRHIGFERRLAVFITVDDLQQSIRRNHAAVHSGQILRSIQPPGDVPDFTVRSETEALVLLQNFLQVNLHLLPFVGKVCFSSCDLQMLARITQCNGNRFGIEHHAVGSFSFKNLVSG